MTIFQNSRTSEPLIVEICMTTQIEAKKVYFTNMLSSILQLMPILFNHRSKTAKKRQNRHIRETRENRGKVGKFVIFCRKSKIYIEIHILTTFENDTCFLAILEHFLIFGLFIKEIPGIGKKSGYLPSHYQR